MLEAFRDWSNPIYRMLKFKKRLARYERLNAVCFLDGIAIVHRA